METITTPAGAVAMVLDRLDTPTRSRVVVEIIQSTPHSAYRVGERTTWFFHRASGGRPPREGTIP